MKFDKVCNGHYRSVCGTYTALKDRDSTRDPNGKYYKGWTLLIVGSSSCSAVTLASCKKKALRHRNGASIL